MFALEKRYVYHDFGTHMYENEFGPLNFVLEYLVKDFVWVSSCQDQKIAFQHIKEVRILLGRNPTHRRSRSCLLNRTESGAYAGQKQKLSRPRAVHVDRLQLPLSKHPVPNFQNQHIHFTTATAKLWKLDTNQVPSQFLIRCSVAVTAESLPNCPGRNS